MKNSHVYMPQCAHEQETKHHCLVCDCRLSRTRRSMRKHWLCKPDSGKVATTRIARKIPFETAVIIVRLQHFKAAHKWLTRKFDWLWMHGRWEEARKLAEVLI